MLMRCIIALIMMAFGLAPAQAESVQSVSASNSTTLNDMVAYTYPLSGGGLFQMNVSEGWSDQIQKTSDTQANIIFRPKRGELFEFMVTPIKAKEAEAHSLSTIREAVEKSAKEIQRQALEPTLELVALEGGMAKGYFFKATEKRRLKAGEYKYLTQGILSVGEAVVPFTVLHNDSTGAVSDVALNLLRNATYKSR